MCVLIVGAQILPPCAPTFCVSFHFISLFTQKWQDIVKEVKFLKDCKHENTLQFKACYVKEQTCWVRTWGIGRGREEGKEGGGEKGGREREGGKGEVVTNHLACTSQHLCISSTL